jgi:iron complex outermembrane receptor protein
MNRHIFADVASATAVAVTLIAGTAQAQTGATSPQPVTSTDSGAEGAQATGNASTRDGAGRVTIEDIVVTARKRAAGEALQATPVAATAVSGLELARSNSLTLVDVGKLSPGVAFAYTGKSNQNFSIRGIGISGTTPSDEPSVGIFQDGIYWGANVGALGEMFDLESVEILRGPQGTLFGRNVTGGAVVLHSARPTFEPSATATFGYGYRNTVDASAVLNSPIAGDTVAVRLAAMVRTTDGYYNYVPTGDPYGKDTVTLVRPSILFKPSDDFDLVVRGEYFRQRGDAGPIRGYAPQEGVAKPVVTLPEREGYRTEPGFFDINTGGRGYYNLDVYLASAEMNWKVGGGVVTWVNGYRKVVTSTSSDQDGFPVEAFRSVQEINQHQYSSELRYAADIGDFASFTTGLFYFHQAFSSKDSRVLDKGASNTGQLARLIANDSYAAFAEVDFKLMSELTLTVGGRYTKDKKEAQIAPFGACTPLTYLVCTFGPVRSYTNEKFTPKVGLSYQATPNNLIYASYTQGIRSGGFALRGAPLITPYEPEELTSYEIGTKNDFFDRRLRVNLATYYYDFTNIQRNVVSVDPVIGTVQSVFNAAKAKVKGVDLSINAQITNEFRFDLAYGYVHARYDEFLGFPNPGSLKFIKVPTNTGTIAGTYTKELGDGGIVSLRASATYTDDFFQDDINDLHQDAFTLVDANLQYTFPGGLTSITLWGKNLTSAKYAWNAANLGTRGQNKNIGAPRTYGIRFSRSF